MSTNSCAFDTISVDGFKVGRDRLKKIEFRYGFEKGRRVVFRLFSRGGRRGRKRKYRVVVAADFVISLFSRPNELRSIIIIIDPSIET